MDFAYRFRLNPTTDQQERLAWTLDTCRQVRNHFLHRMNRTENPTYTPEQNRLPDLKQWWTALRKINSKVLQMVVRRLYKDRSNLKKKKDKGHKVGELKWKGKGYYHSFEYNQSGFELKNTSGRDRLYLNKIGDVPVVAHRDVPDDAEVKGVVVKREPTGRWYASLQLETPDDPPEKPDELTETVGIDVGILNYATDTDGMAVGSLDLSDEREGTHYVAVDPRGTTKECAACGVATEKPLWVREHSCPACGFSADRDWNAAYNILVRGLKQVGTGCPNQRLRRLRSLREPLRFLHSASWKQEAPPSRSEPRKR